MREPHLRRDERTDRLGCSYMSEKLSDDNLRFWAGMPEESRRLNAAADASWAMARELLEARARDAIIVKLDNGMRWLTALAWSTEIEECLYDLSLLQYWMRQMLTAVGYTPETLEQP